MHLHSSKLCGILLGGGLLLAALPVAAQTFAYDNYFGTPDGFYYSGWSIAGANASTRAVYSPGFVFTAANGGSLDSVTAALSRYENNPPVTLTLTLTAGVAGTVLESWVTSDLPNYGIKNVVTFDSKLSPTLVAGETYYLFASAAEGTVGNWGTSKTVAGDVYENGTLAYHNQAQGAFRVTVQAIPEPSTYALFVGVAALGLAVWRRRLRR